MRPVLLMLLMMVMTGRDATVAPLRPPQAGHGYRVIAHSHNPVNRVTRDFLTKAFLKKVREWPDGEMIRPVDQRPDTRQRGQFTRDVLLRSVGAVKSYWQQAIFSGRDVPPPELESDEQAVLYVRRNRGGLAYVSEIADVTGVKLLNID